MIFVLTPPSISQSGAVSSSYAARTAPAGRISLKRCRCSRPDAACAGRSWRNAPGSAAPAACAVDRGRGGRREPSARLGLEAGRERRDARAPQPHRPRARRLVARLLRPCAPRLADAGDGFAVRRAGERAAPLSRSLRAGDRSGSRRPGLPVRAGFARTQPALEEGGRNAQWLDAIEREAAELGVAVAAARLDCVRRLEALIAAERDDSSPFPWAKLALQGEIEAITDTAGARRGRPLSGELARQPRPRRRGRAHPDRPASPIFWSGTGRSRPRPPPPRPASRRR